MSTYLAYEVVDKENEFHHKYLWFREWEDVCKHLLRMSRINVPLTITPVFLTVETVQARTEREEKGE